MHTLLLISQILGLVSLVAFIWLVVLAFKRRVWWGVGVLLLSPITATIFALKYWDEVKKPFLAYIVTLFASMGAAIYVFTAWGGWEMVKTAYHVQQGIENKTLTEEEAKKFMKSGLDFMEKASKSNEDRQEVAEMRKVLEKAESGSTEKEKRDERSSLENTLARIQERAAKPETQGQTDTGSEGPRSKEISFDQAKDYIGASVILTGKSGLEQEGILIAVSGNMLRLEKRMSGGKISFEMSKRHIESLRVLPE